MGMTTLTKNVPADILKMFNHIGRPIRLHSTAFGPMPIRALVQDGLLKQIAYETTDRFEREHGSEKDRDILVSDNLCTYQNCYEWIVETPTTIKVVIYDGEMVYGDRRGLRCHWILEGEILRSSVVQDAVRYEFQCLAERRYEEEQNQARKLRIEQIKSALLDT